MPFEFVCPFCHHRTRVDDKFAGQSGPCVNCGRTVSMPTFDKNGLLIDSAKSSKSITSTGGVGKGKNWLPLAIVLASIATMVIALGVSVYLAIPLISRKASLAAQRSDSENMIAIAQALNAYALRHGTYPTPIVRDASGRALYSWRVLILPFLGYQDLYNQFQLDQPHDSPANLSLDSRMPREFASKFSGGAAFSQTNYALVIGAGTLFPPEGPMAPADAEDPTILLVETTSGICSWSEPMDIDASKGVAIGSKPMKEIGGIHKDVVLIVTVTEKAYAVPSTNSQNLLDALVTPKGGEIVDLSNITEL